MSEKGETIAKWKTFSKLWHCYNKYNIKIQSQECNLHQVHAKCSKEEEIFPLITQEIADAQKADGKLKYCFKRNAVLDKGLEVSLVDNILLVCREDRTIIPKPLLQGTVLWFHHYLQHPGHTSCLVETMNATIY
jgi:hypothetical protein